MIAAKSMAGSGRRWMRVALAFGLMVLGSGPGWAGDERPVVAVFDVQVKFVKLPRAKRAMLTELLGQELGLGGAFQVMPPGDVKSALTQHSAASYKACYDEQCQIELGRQLPANKMVTTTLMKIGGECRLAASLYDLKRQTTDLTARATGGCKDRDLVSSIEQVAAQLRAWRSGAERGPNEKAGALADPKNGAAVPDERPEPAEGGLGIKWARSAPAGLEITVSEITVAQYRACYEAGTCTSPKKTNEDWACNWSHADRDAHPVNCVDWQQATAFCRWAGGRLLSEQEWQAEASAKGERVYPWGGQDPTCDRAISARRPENGGVATNGCGKYSTWPVCSKIAGNSVSGLCDLSGNVREWTSSPWDNSGVRWVVRGGAWDDSDESHLRASHRAAVFHTYRLRDVGFRCGRGAAR